MPNSSVALESSDTRIASTGEDSLDATSLRAYLASVLKPAPPPVACSAEGCSQHATILHKGNPYCGGHALELLEIR